MKITFSVNVQVVASTVQNITLSLVL